MAEQTETAVAETQVQDTETTQTEEENTLLNSDQNVGNTVTEHHDDDDDDNDPVDNVEPDDAEVAGTTGVDEAVDTNDAEVSDTENVADPDTVDDTNSEATADQAANSEDDSQEGEDEEAEQPIDPFTKIVFLIRPGMSTIGIQRNGTDPEFQSVTSGELEDVLAAAPQAYSQAIEKWNKAPKRKSAKPVQRTIKAATLAPAKTKKAKDETSNLKLF